MRVKKTVYPYIPNSEPVIKGEMLAALGVRDIEAFYADIPEPLRLKQPMDLPAALLSETELVRHVETILAKNHSSHETLSFLGGGCYQHQVPAVCAEVISRSEFLTAYAGEPYEDHGRFQALFEYQSLMGELLNMDVVNVPNYDGYQAAATALRMAGRITGRHIVLLPERMSADKFSLISNYLKPDIQIRQVASDPISGLLDVESVRQHLSNEIGAVYIENPTCLGAIETQPGKIVDLAHQVGALCVVSVDPISLGVLSPPADYGADIACGDIQSLGIQMNFGGGQAGFIASRDEKRFVMEYPSRLFGVVPTIVAGEYGFGDVAYERTSFALREQGKEWVGTAAALWGISAGVYLALMGPQGMREIGERILQRTRFAMKRIAAIEGIKILYVGTPHFREFGVDFNKTGKSVAEINKLLLDRGIFGGKDLSHEMKELGQSALYCVTEIHTQADIERLVAALQEVVR